MIFTEIAFETHIELFGFCGEHFVVGVGEGLLLRLTFLLIVSEILN